MAERLWSVFWLALVAALAGVCVMARANVIGPTDDRGALLAKAAELGLSDSEVARLRKTTGYVECPADGGTNRSTGSGFLVSADYVLTVAHIFYDRSGEARKPLETCFFQTQEARPRRIPLLVEDPRSRLGLAWPKEDGRMDYALVRLQQPLNDAAPFALDLNMHSVCAGTTVIGVTALQTGLNSDRFQPVVRGCSVKRVLLGTVIVPTAFYSDCDLTEGGSGGVNLVRVGGELRAVGLFVGSGHDQKKHLHPYDEDQDSMTYTLGLSGRLLRELTDLGVKAPL